MGRFSPTVVGKADAVSAHTQRRRPPTSQAERERRAEFGKTYGNIMREIKRDRERRSE